MGGAFMISASGPLYLSKTEPLATTAADGTFALTILAMDRIAAHQVEPYRISYSGAQAFLFWEAHGTELVPGTPISVRLQHLRTFTNGRNGAPEIHARAEHIDLLPRAHSLTKPQEQPCPQ